MNTNDIGKIVHESRKKVLKPFVKGFREMRLNIHMYVCQRNLQNITFHSDGSFLLMIISSSKDLKFTIFVLLHS